MSKLRRSFYDRDPITVAKELLGQDLVHVSGGVERIGRIVEVEAYLGPHDLTAHSARGLTRRTRVMASASVDSCRPRAMVSTLRPVMRASW